ncbi:MAG TPA: ATP-binding protein, partial [Candidatus Sumerlaeota bacterium]|nr:ATP-binding protein [Candidatus Sumerlaeota bacterium]
GIRDEHGKLLQEDRLPEIFRLGFSTKENQEGEGLGLNWVQTIVREFHGGELVAQNHAKGGARFTIRLPIKKG